MDKKLKGKWVKALRSGKYEQGLYTLKKENRYCCLGVLRHIQFPNSNASQNGGWYLCERHQNLAGLDYSTQEKLSQMNDSGKWSFKRIATYIEKNL